MLNKLIKIANILDANGFYKEANTLDSIMLKIAGIEDEGGLQDPETPKPTAIIDQINQTDNNLPIYNKVANDLAQFFNSFHEHDDILIHSLEQDQTISSIAKNNGIDEEIIVDAIYHMIGSHNPLNPNQIQAALYEVSS